MTRRHTATPSAARAQFRLTGSLRLAAAVVAAVSMFLAGGCGGDAETSARERARQNAAASIATSSATIEPTKHYTVQQLAATVGCTAKLQGQTKDFRQAACAKGKDEFVLFDFDSADGQRAWLDNAVAYGGVYLVGDRWALSGKSKEDMESLRGTLGGTIHKR